ncbi:MAG: type II toxin-antitoxin system RatA family toxin [Rickettsiales bacterium]
MPRHFIERELPYTPKECFDLVADVESYPKFLPWCESAKTIERLSDKVMLADLTVHFRGVRGKYTSRVECDRDAKEIHVELAQGLFKHLIQGWKFVPAKNGAHTLVEFDLDFALRSFLLEKLADMAFDHACKKMMAAFMGEAEKRYGKRASA